MEKYMKNSSNHVFWLQILNQFLLDLYPLEDGTANHWKSVFR